MNNNIFKLKISYEKAEKIANVVKLNNHQDHFPDELSGGNKELQLQGLISETDLVLADEPTGNLDFKTSQEIFSYFLKLKKIKKNNYFCNS